MPTAPPFLLDAARLRTAGLIVGVWMALGVLLGTQSHVNSALAGHPTPLLTAVSVAVERYLIYALLTFPLLWLCRRFPFTSRRWAAWMGVHALGLAAFVLSYSALRTITGSVRDAETLRPVPPTLETMATLLRATFFEQFWMYASIVSVVLVLESYRRDRRRERDEADLRRQVAEYRLQVLRLQLHPHFLFNAINGIATLMQRDGPAAREMLLRLSDLLRIALAREAENETSLREEIEFVRAYLDLERMRFGDRLVTRLSIAPESLDARVPYMILQPLVENAIRHGIAAIRSGGALDLATACRDGRLQIRIANDGPAAAAAGEPRASGIGLQNARARLRQLYGDAGRLRLVSRPQGGAELLMELPLRGVAVSVEGAA